MAKPPPRPSRPTPATKGGYVASHPGSLGPGPRPGAGGARPNPKPGAATPGYRPTGGMTASQTSAFDTMNDFLGQYGLGSLSGFVKDLILKGTTDSATLMLELQNTAQWKQRFAGNEMLRAKGLGVLSPAEYLSLERSYGQIMKNYGLPDGFYNDPSDYAKWIGNNVSAAELQQRVSAYADVANRTDPAVRQQLQSMGMTQGDLLAFVMDPGRAQPVIQQKYQQTLLGAASRRAGYTADNEYLAGLASRGITEQQAAQGFGQVADSLHAAETMGLTAKDLEGAVFDNNTSKVKRLASQERAQFGGSSGVAGGSLSRNTSGSY